MATKIKSAKGSESKKATAAAPDAERGSAAVLEVGTRAPGFRLARDSGAEVSLADYAGKWLVLYFYPRDATPGCTREAIGFRDAMAELRARGAAVLGVSRDSVESHGRFRDAQQLTFPLLSDPDASVHAAYGAYGEKTLYGKKTTGALRTTVLIAPDGKVARVFRNVKVDGHAEAVLRALDALSG